MFAMSRKERRKVLSTTAFTAIILALLNDGSHGKCQIKAWGDARAAQV